MSYYPLSPRVYHDSSLLSLFEDVKLPKKITMINPVSLINLIKDLKITIFLWFPYISMVFLWFSYGFPMVLLWFSHGFVQLQLRQTTVTIPQGPMSGSPSEVFSRTSQESKVQSFSGASRWSP